MRYLAPDRSVMSPMELLLELSDLYQNGYYRLHCQERECNLILDEIKSRGLYLAQASDPPVDGWTWAAVRQLCTRTKVRYRPGERIDDEDIVVFLPYVDQPALSHGS